MKSPLHLSERTTILPIVHGSGDSARVVEQWLLANPVDLLAVPLPPSFGPLVRYATAELPRPSIVLQRPQHELIGMHSENIPWSYVPIDPCQPVIAGIRFALGEHIPVEFIDLETDLYRPYTIPMPDPYALKEVAPARFAAAVLTELPRPRHLRTQQEICWMGEQLRRLERQHDRILFLCSVQHWPWIREAYFEPLPNDVESELVAEPEMYEIDHRCYQFLFQELPFVAALYERARAVLASNENLSIDGIKKLLIYARSRYRSRHGKRARQITPMMLSQCLKYMRNLSLIQRRMSPDLYTIAIACKQILGDQFAIEVIECSGLYPEVRASHPSGLKMSVDRLRLPDQRIVPIVSRLPGPPMHWRSLQLQRRPTKVEKAEWRTRWNPLRQCSWPPEDTAIESLRTRVVERARSILGADLARTEKFSTSFRDGIDIRETLRHWYEREIYVKVMPPSIGTMDGCIMLFDSPAHPRDYPWRSTWFAEHQEESTIAFYASDFRDELIGPGVAVANYGGVLFLFPPRSIPDIWTDKAFDFTESLEERLIAACCLYSESRQVALLSWLPPGRGWKRLAKRFQKTLIHVPLSGFNDALIKQLRTFHVLNGQEVRSYAAHFIRKV